jgi:hypothetical protein
MTDAGEWQRLCALLDEDESVWQAVEEALDAGEDPWEALLDGLDEAGALAYLQTEDTGMELSDALAQLPRVFRLQPDLGEVTDTDELDAATAAADRILSAADLRVVRLVEEDDAWPVVVVPASAVAEIERLIGGLGHEAVLGA